MATKEFSNIGQQKKQKMVKAPGGKLAVARRQVLVWVPVATLVVGFIAGGIFGVMKTGPIPGGPSVASPTASGKSPARMFQALEAAAAVDPKNTKVWVRLGNAYFDADPKHEVSRMNKGIVLLYDLKDEAAAVEAWESLLALNPLATFGDGQSVDELVRHYEEGHEEEGGGKK